MDGIVLQPGMARQAAGGGGLTTINPATLLRWWENGGDVDLASSVDVSGGFGATSSETVGAAFDTVWTPTGTNNSAFAPNPTSWDAYTIALVVKPTASGILGYFWATDSFRDYFRMANSSFAQIRTDGGSALSENVGNGSWLSMIFTKDSTNGRLYVNGTLTDTTTNGASPPSSVSTFMSGADIVAACVVVADETWGQDQVDDFHNAGNYLAYSDL